MSNTVLQVDHLYKEYRLGLVSSGDFFMDMQTAIGRLFGRKDPNSLLTDSGDHKHDKERKRHFLALNDVSFTVQSGDVFGILGHNGAGKSTLLKILTRITAPTAGTIKIKGGIASLLEVGTGFHPEMTGRENVYMNGTILGMKRWQIAKKMDEIVAFSEVEKFIDTPVKRYSSGMSVRLAFAVAAHLDAEIMIMDEVLAVGDVNFQQKCVNKMRGVAKDGRTILFVSHRMDHLCEICSRGIILHQGRLVYAADNINEVVKQYQKEADVLSVKPK
ncbi:lipopolysaccharide transport system ATP-binding protein [Candidatus Termititenax persephonae]|uniref:Lipopolysaccharide transport system ATP-binding protein n=1 Tax=Candidatus Termititenax persephonae TaxID=2218525 RepID=A0A388TGW9_9BACT|nr:lipopolysaccharide transport system ATP-binding protein [Candidatus Termititenax persephonae]